MPPFSFMKQYFKFLLDTTTLPGMGEYGSIPVMEPTIMNTIIVNSEQEVVLEQKPEGSVSELTMLKALAIAQQPELALNLLKE